MLVCPTLSWACGYNGSGTYVRCFNWTQDAQNGIPIEPGRFDTEDNGFAQGLSQVMTLNGQSTVTANLPMSGFHFTNVGDALTVTDFAAAGQVQNNGFNFGQEAGSSNNAYVVGNGIVTPAALSDGQLLWFRAPSTNTSGATINWDSLGATSITKNGLLPLSAGDVVSGTLYGLMYDETNNVFQLLTPAGSTNGNTPQAIVNSGTTVTANLNGISLTVAGTSVANLTSSTLSVSGSITTGKLTATNISATSLTVAGNPILFSGFQHAQAFTVSGTYTFTPSTTMVYVEGWSGGGGGGGAPSSNGGIGAGGGSGASFSGFVSVTPNSSITVVVGGGGTGGANTGGNGTAGGTTSFAGTLTASGGAGGTGYTTTNVSYPGGAGGAASGGLLNIAGQRGSVSGLNSGATTFGGGFGGNAPRGGNGGNMSNAVFTAAAGEPGASPGGGGSGGAATAGNARAGGNGGDGQVIVYYP